MTTVRVTGLRAINRNTIVAGQEHKDALSAALMQEGFEIMTASKLQVPQDQRILRNSGWVNWPQDTPQGPKVWLSYATEYALYQHEKTELHHDIGNAKYLTNPFEDAKRGYTSRIARRTATNVARRRFIRAR